MTAVRLEIIPHRAALRRGQQNTLDVLFKVTTAAPRPPHLRRAPLNLAIVVDRSGSMSGRPLEEAKRCVGMIIDRLSEGDQLSLVTFATDVEVLAPSQRVRDRSVFHDALCKVRPGGLTALHGGWAKGAEQAALGHAEGGTVSRVILLSDGKANQGTRRTSTIADHCAQMAAAGVTTSTFGLGRGFDETLLRAMARSGQGNAYYGQLAEDLIDPFDREFDLLSQLCGRRLRLELLPRDGVRLEQLNAYLLDGTGRIQLPDIAYGGEAWVVVRLTVPRSLTAPEAELAELLTATLSYVAVDGGETGMSGPVHVALAVLPDRLFEATPLDAMVGRRVGELRAATLLKSAADHARRGNWTRVDSLMDELRGEASLNAWLAASIERLEAYVQERRPQEFVKETNYKADDLRTRLADPGEGGTYSADEEARLPLFVRRKLEAGKQMPPPDLFNSTAS